MSATDGRVNQRIDNYTKFWEKDPNQESETNNENRLGSYTDVVNGSFYSILFMLVVTSFFSSLLFHVGYYDGATQVYEYAWGSSFHFSRFYKGEGFYQSLARHEHYLAAQMQLRPGMRVLDVGCGVGGPAREIATFMDVNIVGINNNEFQVQRARRYTKRAGLDKQVTYVRGDFMKLAEQFGENSFDAGVYFLRSMVGWVLRWDLVYAIEATCHAPSWEGIYGEIKKILKPGGVVGVV